MLSEVISQGEIEERILRLCDQMDTTLDDYREVSEQRASAEADYKYAHSRALIEQGSKSTVAAREAVAHLRASTQYREWRLLETRERACQQMLTSLRSQIDALRTLSANVRYMTR